MARLLDLPDELIAHIASLLSPTDLLTLQQVSVRLHALVTASAALQYALELHVAGMVDNPAARAVPGERLHLLRRKTAAWRTLDLHPNVGERTVLPLRHSPSGIYDLTGGVLLLGERRHAENHTGTDSVHTVQLHAAFTGEKEKGRERKDGVPPLWRTVDLGKQVIDVGLAIQEHDLIAIVTYSYINAAQLYASIDIHLIQHSTGQPHPAAAKPVLHFDNIHYLPGHCSIMLEVAGDTLCFLLNNYFPFVSADPVTLVIYNWKTGLPKVGQKRVYSDPTMFNSFVLLSPDTVVLPIIPTNALEICHFSKELAAPPPPPHQGSGPPPPPDVPLLETTCILELPPLQQGALVLRMTCRCEPNPRGPSSSATYADRHAPFLSDPDTALMILHMHVRLPLNTSRMYTLIVHRSSLVEIFNRVLEQRLAAEEQRQKEREQRVLILKLLLVEPEMGREDEGEGEGEGGDGDDRDDEEQKPVTMSWTKWGPRVTRWFQDELAGTRWITTTCGQRLVRVRSHPKDRLRLHVYDFNRRALKRFLHERKQLGEPFGTRKGESILEEGMYEWPRRGSYVYAIHDDDDDDEPEEMDVDRLPVGRQVQDGALLADGWVARGLADEPQEIEMHDAAGPIAHIGPGNGKGGAAHGKRQVRVVLGTTVIEEASVWKEQMESSLPYVETSVRLRDEYEGALLDEDVIICLKMDANGRHITEVVLHRIGGPVS